MPKYKLIEDSESYIIIQHNNGQSRKLYSIDWGKGINGKDAQIGVERLENNLLKGKTTWERATLFNKSDDKILNYYHQSSGIQRLNKAAYNAALGLGKKYKQKISIYIVPSRNARLKGNHKGLSINHIGTLEDIPQYFNTDVQHIQVYINSKLTYKYTGTTFQEVAKIAKKAS